MRRTNLISRFRPNLLARRAALSRSLDGEWSLLAYGDDDEYDDGVFTHLSWSESRELHAIDEALQRMRAGNYGVCEYCGRNISLARLEALPYASTCIHCQRENEAHPANRRTRELVFA